MLHAIKGPRFEPGRKQFFSLFYYYYVFHLHFVYLFSFVFFFRSIFKLLFFCFVLFCFSFFFFFFFFFLFCLFVFCFVLFCFSFCFALFFKQDDAMQVRMRVMVMGRSHVGRSVAGTCSCISKTIVSSQYVAYCSCNAWFL